MTTNVCFIESSALYIFHFYHVNINTLFSGSCDSCLCPRSYADQRWESCVCCSAQSNTEMTTGGVKCGWHCELGSSTLGPRYCSHQAKKKPAALFTDSQLSPCWCRDHCGCVWLWCGWEAAVPTACLPASPFECIGALGCPTTWLSFPTWWTTTTRTSQLLLWRWDLKMDSDLVYCKFNMIYVGFIFENRL